MKRLTDYATNLGVTIEYVNNLDPHHPGDYSDSKRRVRILDGMNYTRTLCTLAHELGHATHRHTPALLPRDAAKQERIADEWAAHFLINADDYRHAESRYGTRTDWIAQELGLLERLITAYERTLHRIGDTIYVNPRMGAGQYAARISLNA